MDSPKPLTELYDDFEIQIDRTSTPSKAKIEEFQRALEHLDQRLLAAPEHERAELENRSRSAHDLFERAWAEWEHPTITSPQRSSLADYAKRSALARDYTEWEGFDR